MLTPRPGVLRRSIIGPARLYSAATTPTASTAPPPSSAADTSQQNQLPPDPVHGYGTVPHFEKHWSNFFATCADTFELQRGLNNCFNYDLVPTAAVVEQALLACRRLNSFATGVRVFGGLRGKVADDQKYQQYLDHFRPLMEASGLCTPEDLGRHD